jgi:hypothetical protein
MIQVKIKNVASQQYTHGAQFPSQEEAQAWINQHSHLNGPWGNPEHEVQVLDEDGKSFDPPQYETVPTEFEVEIEDITDMLAAAAAKQAKINAGKAARLVCEQVLDFIAGSNLDKELTIEQITQMQQTFAQTEAALRAGRPTFAKIFITAIEPDGILVSQEIKDNCLEILAAY